MARPALTETSPPTFFRKRRREIFALLATFLFLVAAETVVRLTNLVGRPTTNLPGMAANLEQSILDDPELFWRFKPSQAMDGDRRVYHINALGLRDREVAVPKPAGVYRILSLGESTTFGAGVALPETYTKVAEHLLRQRFPTRNIETVNAGVGAYTSFQCVKYLELEGKKLEPDMIWLFSEANDGLASFVRNYKNLEHGFGYTDRELHETRNRYAGLLSLLNHSDLYKLLRRLQTIQTVQSYKQYVAGDQRESAAVYWKPRVPPADRRDNLLRFVTLSGDLGAVPVFLLPAYFNSRPAADRPLRGIAEDTNTPLIDLPAAVHASGRFGESWYSQEELGGHPNALGHRLMGEAIAADMISFYEKKGW
ncbi:MAG: SGNH/GDSL hydrolase family protein [Candidatus Lernaella stagnicola]|nr:SGNH/GDSL hydrolase family protein [Candidatus Lernaella stagnicola]